MKFLEEYKVAATEFNKAKQRFEPTEARMKKAVCRFANAYKYMKTDVSTVNWRSRYVTAWKIGESDLKITFTISYNGGGGHDSYMMFPLSVLDVADVGTDQELREAITKILEDERRDIEERTAMNKAKYAAERQARIEEAEIILLRKLAKQYPGVA